MFATWEASSVKAGCICGSTLFGTDEFSSVPFLYMMTKKGQLPQHTHGNCPKKGIKSSRIILSAF